jgi:hypothetical protein
MARSIYAITFCCGLSFCAPGADALSITNRDTAEHKLVVTENGAAKDVVLKPSELLDGVCMKGCTVKTADGEEYDFDGTEVVSIEEGLMFLDEPVEGGATGPGGEVGDPPTTEEPDAAPAEPKPDGEPKKAE